MKKTFKKAGYLFGALLLSVASVLTLLTPKTAHALLSTCTWTGAGNDGKFSTASNWTNCNSAAPVNGSDLVFDDTGFNSQPTLDNDIANFSVGNITFQGSSGYSFDLTGNQITVTNGIADNTTGTNATTIIENTINVSGNQSFTIPDFTTFTNITGSGNIALSGGGALDIQGMSSYTGTISTTDSGVSLDNSGSSFTSSGGVTVSGTGYIALDNLAGNNSSITYSLPLSLGGSGPGNGTTALILLGDPGTFVLSGSTTLTSNTQVSGDGILDITGPLSGNYALSIASGQSVTIENNSSHNTSNTPSGTQGSQLVVTTVSAGDSQPSLAVDITADNEYVIDGVRGSTTVESGGILKGDGTVGNLKVKSGGIVAPGHSPGCITVNGNLNQGGTYQAELGGTTACSGYDQLVVTGNVMLDDGGTPPHQGTLQVSLVNGFTPSAGQSFEIINNQGSQPVSDTFSGLPEGSEITVSGYVFKITYKGGDGNDVILSVVSVPTSPNTGFGLTSFNPGLPLLGSLTTAVGLYIISRKVKKPVIIRRR